MENVQESLKEVFGFSKIDAGLRSYAGMYIDGHIFSAVEHVACMREYQTKFGEMKKNKTALLHFLEQEDGLVCFVDTLVLPCFRRASLDNVLASLKEQCPLITKVYLYKYPDSILLLDLQAQTL